MSYVNLNENSEGIMQPEKLNIELMEHQKKSNEAELLPVDQSTMMTNYYASQKILHDEKIKNMEQNFILKLKNTNPKLKKLTLKNMVSGIIAILKIMKRKQSKQAMIGMELTGIIKQMSLNKSPKKQI